MKYQVTLQRTIEVTVEVEADTPEQAWHTVSSRDFELPPRDEWTGHKDWQYQVDGPDGETLIDFDDEVN